MFGYVTADKPEMKVKEFETYKSYYCGLCKGIKKHYSLCTCGFLNYDCSFLYILLSSVSQTTAEFTTARCIANPFKKVFYANDSGLDYAAAINVLLTMGKLQDDVNDDKKFTARLLRSVFSRQNKKAKSDFPLACSAINESLASMLKSEQDRCDDIDLIAGQFGTLLGQVMAAGNEEQSKVLFNLGYNLGRWIYIIDALQDIEKDAKNSSYNPFIEKFGKDTESAKESASFNMYASLAASCNAYDLLDVYKNDEIIRNVLFSGLYKRTKMTLNGGKDGSIQSARR